MLLEFLWISSHKWIMFYLTNVLNPGIKLIELKILKTLNQQAWNPWQWLRQNGDDFQLRKLLNLAVVWGFLLRQDCKQGRWPPSAVIVEEVSPYSWKCCFEFMGSGFCVEWILAHCEDPGRIFFNSKVQHKSLKLFLYFMIFTVDKSA